MRPPASLLPLLLTCCGASATPPAETSQEPAPAPSPAPASPAADPSAIIGSWSSPECGRRDYERFLRIEPDGTYSTEDRFDTCAPTRECDGSGVAILGGRYEYSEPGQLGPFGANCRIDTGACIWLVRDRLESREDREGEALADDEASSEDPGIEAIGQYPALLYFEDVPLESDGHTVCRYRRVE